MKKIYTIQAFFGLMLMSTIGLSQQLPMHSNVINNPYLVNPAAGGMTNTMHLELNSRFQWTGYEGAPNSFTLTGNSPVKMSKNDKVLDEFNKSDDFLFSAPEVAEGKLRQIVGGRASFDGIGIFSNTSINATYAIHMPLFKNVNFGVGLGLGLHNTGIRQNRVVLQDQDDTKYGEFLGQSNAQNIFDANGGLVVYNNRFFFSFSINQLFNNQAKFSQIQTESNYNRHYYIAAQYSHPLGEKFHIEPNAVVRLTEKSPLSGDFGIRLMYNRAAWVNLQYRTGNNGMVRLGANLYKNIYLSYGFEFSVGKFKSIGASSHEIQIGFYLGKNRNAGKESKGDKE